MLNTCIWYATFCRIKKEKYKYKYLLKPETRNQIASKRLSGWGPSKGMMVGGNFEYTVNHGFVF